MTDEKKRGAVKSDPMVKKHTEKAMFYRKNEQWRQCSPYDWQPYRGKRDNDRP